MLTPIKVLILGSSMSAPRVLPDSPGCIGSLVTSFTIEVQPPSIRIKLKVKAKLRIYIPPRILSSIRADRHCIISIWANTASWPENSAVLI